MGRVHGIQLRTPLPTTLLNLRTVMKVTLFILLVGAVVETMGQDDYSWSGQFVPTSRHCSFDRYRWINDGELLQSLPSSSAHECMFLCKYREQRASDTDIRQPTEYAQGSIMLIILKIVSVICTVEGCIQISRLIVTIMLVPVCNDISTCCNDFYVYNAILLYTLMKSY